MSGGGFNGHSKFGIHATRGRERRDRKTESSAINCRQGFTLTRQTTNQNKTESHHKNTSLYFGWTLPRTVILAEQKIQHGELSCRQDHRIGLTVRQTCCGRCIFASFFYFWPHSVVKRGICYEKVCPSVCPTICLSVCLLHLWVIPKRFIISKYRICLAPYHKMMAFVS